MLRVFLLIVVGLAGDPEHGTAFEKWGASMAAAAGRLGVEREHVVLLGETGEGQTRPGGRATKEEVVKAFDAFAKTATPEDIVFVTLLGHGSFDGTDAKFNLPGPDISAREFNALIRKLPTRQVVFVNTSSSSGPFIEELSGPGRTIVTATRNGAERYATLFGGFFVDGLTSETADADKNKRISVLEAFLYAKGEVTRAYEREGLLATEHALLDDNGDKQGSPDPLPTAADGKLASALSVGSTEAAVPLPADPKLRALVLEQRDLERRVEALRLLKDSMEPARYSAELERLVTELALKAREIRQGGR
ncbi:MAG: C13 family peptidase [Vicinamibacterales bacterium]